MPPKSNKLQIIVIAVIVCLVVALQFTSNSYFLVFIGVAIVLIGIAGVIAQIVLKRKRGDDGQPSPLAQKVRQSQEEQENTGWRIEMISYDDPFKPMMIQTNGIAAVGALAFIIGFFLLATNPGKYKSIGLWLAVGGFFVALFGIWFKARNARKNWEVVTARCVDRELKRARIFVNGRSGWGWFWRIICEYEYLGKAIRVTPTVYWSNFTSEEAAKKFLEERMAPDGECKLHINPKNPLQTELFGQGIKDKLLYSNFW